MKYEGKHFTKLYLKDHEMQALKPGDIVICSGSEETVDVSRNLGDKYTTAQKNIFEIVITGIR